MKIPDRNATILVMSLPALLSLLVTLVWFVVYGLRRTSAISFDGSAGGALLMSIFFGAVAGMLVSLIMLLRTKRATITRGIMVFLCAMVSMVVIGYLAVSLAMSLF